MAAELSDAVVAFATVLRSAGYSVRGVRDAIGSGAAVSLSPTEVVAAQSRLEPGSRLASLIELFLLGVELPGRAAEAALAPVPVAELTAAGVIEQRGDMVRARIRVLPYEDLLIACDRDPELDGRLEPDHVGAIHASSVLLARITPRRRVEHALDIGCGCGFQALLLARHADAVLATDVNPRALEFGRLNAELNGIENITWRLGDGVEPALGERFDLVVANPPYVIAPRSRFAFRDSPLPGDAFCEQLVRETPGLLTPGGIACLLASWIVGAGEAWSTRPAAWAEASGRGRVLLHLETVDAASNAVRWAVPRAGVGRAEATSLVREWIEHYRAEGIRTIAYGAVVLHPTPALTLIELAGTPGPEAAAQIERIIDGHALLVGGAAASLLDAVLTLPAGHRLDWTLEASAGAWQLRRSQVSVDGGLGLGVDLDRAAAQILARLDGSHTVRELLRGDAAGASLDRLGELVRAGLIGISHRP
jgi:SAM-dependent methyltransferase